MTKRKVWIDSYSWFEVSLDDNGEATNVIECAIVWSPGMKETNRMLSERVRRAIEAAKKQDVQ